MKAKILTASVLLGLFLITVFIRIPYISNEVLNNNQGHMILITTLKSFVKQGLADSKYSPIQTYNNPGDKNITYYQRLVDEKGNNYYVSHPPFVFMFNYIIFKILGSVPNQLTLQIIGLILHFISAIFIYFIIMELFDKKEFVLFLPAVIAYTTYLFVPVMLYIHLYHIFSELFVQPFWIIGIYYFLRKFKQQEILSARHNIFTGIIIFFMVYTEWLGVFFALTIMLLCVIYRKIIANTLNIFISTTISMISALALITFQYSQPAGLFNFIHSLYIRFLERSGLFGNEYSDQGLGILNPDSYILLLQQINNLMGGLGYLLLIIILIIVIILLRKHDLKHFFPVKGVILLTMSILPAFLYFILFFNASIIHYVYVAKFAVPLSIATGVFYSKFFELMNIKHSTTFFIVFTAIKVFVIIISIYIFITKIPKEANNPYLKEVANIINANSKPDEAIFIKIKSKAYNPIIFLNYASKRNIMYAVNVYEAKKILEEKHKPMGVFYTFDQRKKYFTVTHFVNN